MFEARHGGVIYYLLDNQYYFKRKGLYGHYDDAERFSFLSRAALEMLPYIDFKPDIIHCNDWQTALVPIYYSLFYANNDWYQGIKTCLPFIIFSTRVNTVWSFWRTFWASRSMTPLSSNLTAA